MLPLWIEFIKVLDKFLEILGIKNIFNRNSTFIEFKQNYWHSLFFFSTQRSKNVVQIKAMPVDADIDLFGVLSC